jgi:hypothetical protein
VSYRERQRLADIQAAIDAIRSHTVLAESMPDENHPADPE